LYVQLQHKHYVKTGYKWKNNPITYYYYNSTRGKTYFEKGAAGWSGTDAKLNYTGNLNSYNILCSEVSRSDVSWDGITNCTVSGSYYKTITLKLNLSATNTWNNNGALESVAIHEFGHCLGLNEYNAKVIMNPYTWGPNSRYGDYKLTKIQTDDKNGVNALY
ncbi:MAG: matrixin family metalloprotease, partial [Eubacterium sp.]|nr:matrixin family metalloprotease [Eubacterium sp.]